MVDWEDKVEVDIVLEVVQTVVEADDHNQVDEIPCQNVVVVVPYQEHWLVEMAVVEEEVEIVFEVVAVDQRQVQEKVMVVDELEELIDVENRDVVD